MSDRQTPARRRPRPVRKHRPRRWRSPSDPPGLSISCCAASSLRLSVCLSVCLLRLSPSLRRRGVRATHGENRPPSEQPGSGRPPGHLQRVSPVRPRRARGAATTVTRVCRRQWTSFPGGGTLGHRGSGRFASLRFMNSGGALFCPKGKDNKRSPVYRLVFNLVMSGCAEVRLQCLSRWQKRGE